MTVVAILRRYYLLVVHYVLLGGVQAVKFHVSRHTIDRQILACYLPPSLLDGLEEHRLVHTLEHIVVLVAHMNDELWDLAISSEPDGETLDRLKRNLTLDLAPVLDVVECIGRQ